MPAVPSSQIPTTEKGAPSLIGVGGGIFPWAQFIDDREFVPDLQWPRSREVYAAMQTDAQIKGMLLALTLPIRRFRWELEPNGARSQVVEHISKSLNLPIAGQDEKPTNQRRRKRFSHDKHLQHALRALAYGHFYFERVYEWGDPAEGGDGYFHLKKLGTRPPRTIESIEVSDSGDLMAIRQNVGRGQDGSVLGGAAALTGTRIEARRLLAYVWDSEDDGDYIGRSMLRACYRNWIAKDRLIRVDMVKHERNAMGIPWFEVDAAASPKQIDDLAEVARRMRAGEESGGAGPGKLSLKGVDGNLPDTIGSVREHDHQMSRAFLSMVFELGTSETGSYSLGGTFHELMLGAQDTAGEWYRDRMQGEQIEDEVAINWGETETPPLLVGRRIESEQVSLSDFANLVDKGAIAVDEETSAYLKTRFGIPAKKPEAPAAPPPPGDNPPPEPSPNARARRTEVAASAGDLPDRDLRRQPYTQEVEAAVDFAKMEKAFTSGRAALVKAVKAAQVEQVDALVTAVEAHAGDAAALAVLKVDPIDSTVIEGPLHTAVSEGIASAKQEHDDQVGGVSTRGRTPVEAALADGEAADEQMDERAAAVALILADAIAQAASRKASAQSSLSKAELGAAVREHLNGLSPAFLEEQLGGAWHEGYNAGRKEFMKANKPQSIYASELMDGATCDSCIGVDGTEYPDMPSAESDYPLGGYASCDGGLRCRGTLVAKYV